MYTNTNINTTSFTLPSGQLFDGGQFRWQVTAFNSAGEESSGSNLLYFQISLPAPPGNPTAQSPGTSSAPGSTLNTATPSFSWTNVTGASRYGLYISKAPYGSSNLVYTNTNINTTSFTLPSGQLSDGGQYRWQVSAFNSAGQESSGSNLLYFQVSLSTPPGNPTAQSPGTSSAPGSTLSTTTPSFSWTNVTGASRYGLYISKAPYGSSNLVYTNTNINTTSFTIPSGQLSDGGQYRWQVSAFNSAGQESSGSNLLYFQVSVPASNPTAQSPGTSSAPGSAIGTTTPTFTWIGVSGVGRYGFYISKAPYGPSNVIYSNSNVNTTSFTIPSGQLSDGGQYRWQVSSFNSAGQESSGSNLLYFQVSTGSTAPDIRVSPLSLTFSSSSLTANSEPLEKGPEAGAAIDWALVSRLAAKAREKGPVRVIVRVNASFTPEGRIQGAQALENQRSAIRAAQDAVLSGLQGLNVTVLATYQYIPYLALQVDATSLSSLVTLSSVLSIEEDVLLAPSLASSTVVIGAPAAWAAGYDGSGQKVAILDSGVDKTHPFFTTGHNKVVSEACYSSNGGGAISFCPGGVTSSTATGSGVNCPVSVTGCDHGTHVAGIAAGNDGVGPNFGVGRGADIIAVQVFSRYDSANECSTFGLAAPCALTNYSDVLSGLQQVYALRTTFSIAAVNMSLGGGQNFSNCDTVNPAMKSAIDNLRSAKIATVIAADNKGYKDAIAFPACISSAISVGATDDADNVASFSNIASFISLLAPGVSIDSSVPGGSTGRKDGTSMAAPHVTGAWAILKQQNPAATVDQILVALRDTGTLVNDNRSGGAVTDMRRINVDKALGLSAPGGQTFTIFNDGSATLSVTSMQLQTAGSWIQWSPQAPFDIAPGGSKLVTVSVDFASAPAGSSTRRLLIASNDPDENPYPGGVDIIVNRSSSPTCYTLSLAHTGSGSNPSASPANSTGCSSGQYTAGATIQLTASPASGWSVGSWSGTDNNGSTSTSNTATMPPSNQTITINYVQAPPTCYTLSLTHTGSGSNPSASPGNSTDCSSGQYTAGAAIQLTASPASGWSVGSWSGTNNNGSTSTSNTATMPASNQTITVSYVQAQPTCYALTLTHTGSGGNPSASPGNSTGCSSGQYTAGAVIQLTASPASGWSVGNWSGTDNNGSTSTSNTTTMPAGSRTVTVNYAQIPSSAILLVDDDDDDPDVRSYYTSALSALGKTYDVWDTGNTDVEPGAVALQAYQTVIWFSGDSYGGAAGPGASGEADLATFLSGGNRRCMILSSQDYLYDRGTTSFMVNYLGLGAGADDVSQSSVLGQGSAFSGLGSYALAFPFSNFSDLLLPGAGAETAFSGDQGGAAISRIGPNHRTIYLGFPFEALPTSQTRQEVMAAALDFCSTVFADVPPKYWSRKFIEAIYRAGITNGCAQSPLRYCPEDVVTRGSMAQMLIAAKEGPSYVPPPCTASPFSDVPTSSPICPWVQELVRRGVTAGCGGGQYCPNNPVTRSQMSVFLLSTWHGAGYAPTACTGSAFNDVPDSSPFCPWIQEMAARGITAGCGGGAFCTESPNTRAQLAVFLATTFQLPLQ
ncbi:MAG: S8 family serine peptidase [Thermoanaerobaculia bacterium]